MSPILDDLVKRTKILREAADELSSRFEDLSSFIEAAQWKADALALTQRFEHYKDMLEAFRSNEERALQEAEAARKALPFYKRIFASQKAEEAYKTNIQDATTGMDAAERSILWIFDLIDHTPVTRAEQKDMLEELRIEKNELSIEKRSVNEEMRIIRTQARQKLAGYTGVSGGRAGEMARSERLKIQQQKENALGPHEDTKTALERQLIDMDKRINRVSRLRGEDSLVEGEVTRCADCGRRVTPGRPCARCGSYQVIRDKSIIS